MVHGAGETLMLLKPLLTGFVSSEIRQPVKSAFLCSLEMDSPFLLFRPLSKLSFMPGTMSYLLINTLDVFFS